MISERMAAIMQSGSAIRTLFEEGKRLAEIHGSENVFDFSIGNPNFPAPDAVQKAIVDITTNEDPIKLHGYMTNAGYPDVRLAIANFLNEKHNTSFSEKNIIMSVGAAGAMNVVLKVLLNPGDEVITISPYFVEYNYYVANYDGKLVSVQARESDFQPCPEAIASAITKNTKAIILNSPNNPTGAVYSKETISQIAAVLSSKEQEYGTSIYIVSDEPYRELVFDGIDVPFVTKYYKNTIVCYSWSKSLSLPGQRIGYILLPSELDGFELIFGAASIATRTLGFINAPALQQRMIARCLYETTDISAYNENRKLMYDGLLKCGFKPMLPQGTFYLWMKAPVDDDREFSEKAKSYNLLLVPGASFGCSGYVRIAFCVSAQRIVNSMGAFKKLAQEYGLS